MATSMQIPPTFSDLATASEQPDNTFVQIIGTVVDIQPPTLAKTRQHMFTFKILDPKLRGALRGEEGLTIRFFKESPEQLPIIRNLGDVILLRSIKMTTFSGVRMALANYTTEFLVFSSSSIPDMSFSIAFKDKQRLAIASSSSGLAENRLNLAEQSYVMQLKQAMIRAVADRVQAQESRKTRSINEVSNALGPPAKRHKTDGATISTKFRTIAQLRDRMFADICVLVVKKSQEDYGCDLYVTDYTKNELMRYYAPPEEDLDLQKDGDQFNYIDGRSKKLFPGPYGHQVLKVNLKPPHAGFAKTSVHNGDYIVLHNIKARITSWSGNAFLEGDLWPDNSTPEQINVRPVKNMTQQAVQRLLERKEKYDQTRQRLTELQNKIEETKNNMSKKVTKREKKAMKRLEKGKSESNGPVADSRGEPRGRPKDKVKYQSDGDDPAGKLLDPDQDVTLHGQHISGNHNPHVRCSYDEVQLKHIKDILDANNLVHTNNLPNGQGSYVLPFINARYRSKVRVVDYFPKDLADFAVPVAPESAADDDYDSMQWQYSNGTPSHHWSFSLVLEAASVRKARHESQVEVQLHHEQAVFLLGNDMDDPDDLRRNPQLLAKLREKLFVLWGNLEEKKQEDELDNMPFECCIMEYGIEIDEEQPEKAKFPAGWRRLYAMFGTTIL